MRRPIPVVVVLLFTLAGSAGAQVQATAPVRAAVQQELQLASTGTTDFGTIGNFAHVETIDPAAPTASQSTAQFTFSSNGTRAFFTCPTEVTLRATDGATMTFKPQLNGNNVDQQSGSLVSVCPRFGTTNSQAWFWLGGSLSVGSNQASGSYSGEYTLSVAYE